MGVFKNVFYVLFPLFYEREGYKGCDWSSLNRKWTELLASIIVGISLYYLAIN